ncbi:MAG: carboxypeptidase regulatory-like domain-containing protein [Bryobacterales bacterium]|nr:carboxypeptidase regulatory-like domain-containing protein [Bryobacterales bacterium]
MPTIRWPMAIVRISFLAISMAVVLFAQDPRGTILGNVTDSSGASIAGAEIRATNNATGVVASARTNETGRFALPFQITGTYTISAELQGFKRSSRDGIQVRIGEVTEISITLEIGEITQTVEVTDTPPVLDTTTPSLGQVLDERRVLELPTLAGNPFELALLTPGVVNGTNMRDRKPAFNNGSSQISTDGSGQYNNEFQIDGVSNTFADNGRARVAFSPPQTAIQEFKMQTSTYDASIGHTLGSVMNVSTKSGTNQLHGEAHWFVRNNAFDAPNFFSNLNNTKEPVYQDNRYGASVGGPVFIPKSYDGRNKTFWFYAWEANKWIVPGNFTSTVPTADQRRGDFSALLNVGGIYQIYDPATIAAAPNGRFSRLPLANNVIPQSRLDTVGSNLANLYPQPTSIGTADFRNNYFNGDLRSLEDYYVHIGRVDHNFSENYRVFFRFHYDFWEEDKLDHFNNRVNGIILNRINRGIALDQVIVFTPTLLLNLRYGLTSQDFPERRTSQGIDLAGLGFASQLTNLVDGSLATLPRTAISGYATLSPWESGDGTQNSLTHIVSANFTKLAGAHSIKFGADVRNYRAFRNRFPQAVSPDFSFSNLWTRGPLDNSPTPPIGLELASMLFGIPGGSMAVAASAAASSNYYGFYFHDDFKLSRNFNLNFGLRYERETPITERFDRLNANFAEGVSNPIEAQARANYANSTNRVPEVPLENFQVRGGLTFAGDPSLGRSPFTTETNNFLPRVGFSWAVHPKTVIRGGYGIFYDLVGINRTSILQTGFSQSTPIQASLDNGLSFIANTSNPLPNGLLAPLGPAGGLTTNLNQGFTVYPERRLNGYAQRFSLGLQQQVGELLVEATYLGNRGTRLAVNRSINNTPNEYLSTSPFRDNPTIAYLSEQFPSPFRGTDPIYGANISRANMLRPFPQFGNITLEEPTGYSWYHSLQSRIEKRFSNGYTIQGAYTWSKAMEALEFMNGADMRPYESLGSLDRPHRLSLSGIYEMPFGRGRRWLASAPSAVDFIAGGWQLNGIITFQSGAPLGFGNAIFIGNVEDIALPASERTVERWFNTEAGFNRVPAQQLASNFRTLPLRFSGVRGDAQHRWDLSAIKNFRIYEQTRLQFRAECFNALNRAIFNNPNTAPTNTAFGTITGTAAQARTFQFALKLEF